MLGLFIKKDVKKTDIHFAIKKANETLPIWLATLASNSDAKHKLTSLRDDLEIISNNHNDSDINETVQNLELLKKIKSTLSSNSIPTTISDYIQNYYFYPVLLETPEAVFDNYLKDNTIGGALLVYNQIASKCLSINREFNTLNLSALWLFKLIKNLHIEDDINNQLSFIEIQIDNVKKVSSGLTIANEIPFGTNFLKDNSKAKFNQCYENLNIDLHVETFSEIYKILKELEKQFPVILENKDYTSIKNLLKLYYKQIPSLVELKQLEANRLEYIKNPLSFENQISESVSIREDGTVIIKGVDKTTVQKVENLVTENIPSIKKAKVIGSDRDIEGFDLIVALPQVDKSNDPYFALFDKKIKTDENYPYVGLPEYYSKYIDYDKYLENQEPQPFEFSFNYDDSLTNTTDEIYGLEINTYAKFYDLFTHNTKISDNFRSEIDYNLKKGGLTDKAFVYKRIQFVSQLMTLITYNTILFSNTNKFTQKLCQIEDSPSLFAIKEVLDTFSLAEARCPQFTTLHFYNIVKDFYYRLFEEAKYIANKTNLTFTQVVFYDYLTRQKKTLKTQDHYRFAGFIARGMPNSGAMDDRVTYLLSHSPDKDNIQVQTACSLYIDTFDYLKGQA